MSSPIFKGAQVLVTHFWASWERQILTVAVLEKALNLGTALENLKMLLKYFIPVTKAFFLHRIASLQGLYNRLINDKFTCVSCELRFFVR